MTLAQALAEKSVLVVGGSGGVGKTTTAAALGFQAAARGRQTLVCTIDPSRRLATSLGLSRLSDEPTTIDVGDQRGKGTLEAMTLDTKRTFDRLIEKHAGSEAARDTILHNRFYKEVSSALAGSHEYMAMERLLELQGTSRWELIILDTPPTRHALDFLDAPDRMLSFLDTSVLRFLLKPYFVAGRLTFKVASRTGAMALKVVDRALGLQFLRDLSEFFLAFEGMYDGFKERAARVHDLLRDRRSAFVVVTSPEPHAAAEARYFHQRLEEQRMPFCSLIVNRMHLEPPHPKRRHADVSPDDLDDELAEKLLAIHRDLRTLMKREERTLDKLEKATGASAIRVPEFDVDVHDLEGLAAIGEIILKTHAPSGERSTRRRSA